MNIAAVHLTEKIVSRTHTSWKRLDIAGDNALEDPIVMKSFAHGYLLGFDNGCRALARLY